MDELRKIREVSIQYNISAWTLRYYEDMGLLSSKRANGYAYRLYDKAAVNRLEQILILRRLNISIKDIQRIFSTTGSEAVLEVLGKKIENIDEEVSLLRELREIILEFIAQIKKLDFERETDIKQLYEKAQAIETRIAHTDYSGSSTIANRFFEVTEKLNTKIPDIMIVRIPPFRAVTSGPLSYEEIFGCFQEWQESHNGFFLYQLFLLYRVSSEKAKIDVADLLALLSMINITRYSGMKTLPQASFDCFAFLHFIQFNTLLQIKVSQRNHCNKRLKLFF